MRGEMCSLQEMFVLPVDVVRMTGKGSGKISYAIAQSGKGDEEFFTRGVAHPDSC